MMSADDEPQVANQSTTNISKSTSTSNILLTNNSNLLVNESFNLNSANLLGSQSIGLLPPSSSHFKPIQSVTPTNDIQNKQSSESLTPTSALFNNQINTSNNNAQLMQQKNNNLSSFFDQPNLSNITSIQSLTPPNDMNKPQLHVPIASKPLNQPIITTSNLPINPLPTNNLISNLPPPVSVPTIPPPPPPSSSTSTSTSSSSTGANPYSARGILNKKVYDTGINVVPINTNQSFLNQPPSSETNLTNNNLFVPQVSTNLNPQSITPPNVNIPKTDFISPIGQPVIGLTDRMSNSLSIEQSNPPTHQNYSQQQQPQQQTQDLNQQSKSSGKMWNWFSPNQFLNNVVTKVVTAVDPQMKDYIHPANRPIYLVSSISHPKIVHSIREAFNDAGFSKISTHGFDAPNTSQFATQIVGYACALQSAKEKLDNALHYMERTNDCLVFSFQDFLAEISTDCWYELAVIMMKDKLNNIELTMFTEALPVSNEDVAQLQQFTPNDYPLKWSGLSCRLAEKNFNFNAAPHFTYLNYDNSDTILSNARLSHALRSMAILYKNKLLAIMNK